MKKNGEKKKKTLSSAINRKLQRWHRCVLMFSICFTPPPFFCCCFVCAMMLHHDCWDDHLERPKERHTHSFRSLYRTKDEKIVRSTCALPLTTGCFFFFFCFICGSHTLAAVRFPLRACVRVKLRLPSWASMRFTLARTVERTGSHRVAVDKLCAYTPVCV